MFILSYKEKCIKVQRYAHKLVQNKKKNESAKINGTTVLLWMEVNKPQRNTVLTALPSLTRFACDSREYVFSHAHTQMNENHTRIGKLAEI